MTKPYILAEHSDFSLVLGGPLFQLYRRTHLSGPVLELLWRRIIVIATLTWLPLLLLSPLADAGAGEVTMRFLYDVEAHVRFLVALPLLIAAELVVHQRMRPVVQQFLERRIIRPEETPKFHAAVDWAMRVRNSVWVELAVLVLVYTLGYWLWRRQIVLATTTWYARNDGAAGPNFTAPGYWYAFISVPIFRFILLRWLLRLAIWSLFLWRVSRLNLRLQGTHPDRAAGLGFLVDSVDAFSLILFSLGALQAGLIANRIFYDGRSISDYKLDAAALITLCVVLVLGPLLMFSVALARAKRQGMREYGLLASGYIQEFEEKWMRDRPPENEQLLGSGDIQSFADMANSVANVREMRITAFGLDAVVRLVLITAAPLLPLVLTAVPFEVILSRLTRIVL
jgi:hypothetical protein